MRTFAQPSVDMYLSQQGVASVLLSADLCITESADFLLENRLQVSTGVKLSCQCTEHRD